ncbi:hypothetical protein M8818_000803 [Zalaria obscura]|uniref:Uncharacterized protein n=1 Tax=Zalaria obscura TaxID=2024903 RepID=A0ACC3SMR1_9PEZI
MTVNGQCLASMELAAGRYNINRIRNPKRNYCVLDSLQLLDIWKPRNLSQSCSKYHNYVEGGAATGGRTSTPKSTVNPMPINQLREDTGHPYIPWLTMIVTGTAFTDTNKSQVTSRKGILELENPSVLLLQMPRTCSPSESSTFAWISSCSMGTNGHLRKSGGTCSACSEGDGALRCTSHGSIQSDAKHKVAAQ